MIIMGHHTAVTVDVSIVVTVVAFVIVAPVVAVTADVVIIVTVDKIRENQPEAMQVGGPEENTRYVPSLRVGGWGENCYPGCRDLNFNQAGCLKLTF